MSTKTPLYDRHVSLEARIVSFGDWLLPVQYAGVLAEHRQCRTAAVVFDTSHMGQFVLRGPAAAEQLGRIGTQDAEALAIGRCRYGFLLNDAAGVLDDTILMRLGEQEFLLVVNAGPSEGDWQWIESHLAGDVELSSLSAAGWGKVDLQGPASARVLAGRVDVDLAALAYFGVSRARCLGRDCILSRTGYTGELGYEIMAAGEDLRAIFEALLSDEAVAPAGLGARDSLRLEMGYPLYGHELSVEHNPIEAGLGMFAAGGREFIGSRRLAELADAGPRRKLVAFRAASRRRTNPANEVRFEGRSVGAVTSGAFSPSLEVSIGLAYVEAPLADVGRELVVDTGRCELPVTVCEKPLYVNGTCRTKEITGPMEPSK